MAAPKKKQAPRPPAEPHPDDRGEYRSTYVVMGSSEEYHALSKDGALMLNACRMTLGACGIALANTDALVEWSKLDDPGAFLAARDELIRTDWLRVQGRVWWLRNGLRFEPSLRPKANPNHRVFIQKALAALPKLAIVAEFARYYADLGIAAPHGTPIPSGTHRDGIDMGSQEDTHRDGIPHPIEIQEPDPDPEPYTEPDTESESDARAQGSPAAEVNGGNPYDDFTPTDAQRARARELHVDLDVALRKWRANRKAQGIEAIDLVADFDGWLEREPQHQRTNGNGVHPEPERPGRSQIAPPREPDPVISDEERAEVQRMSRETLAALKGDAPMLDRLKRPDWEREPPAQLDAEAGAEFEQRREAAKAAVAQAAGRRPVKT